MNCLYGVLFYIKKASKSWRRPTLASVKRTLPSAQVSLTTVFGMRTGVPPLRKPPRLKGLSGIFEFQFKYFTQIVDRYFLKAHLLQWK